MTIALNLHFLMDNDGRQEQINYDPPPAINQKKNNNIDIVGGGKTLMQIYQWLCVRKWWA